MPRRSKTSKFRGIQKQFLPAVVGSSFTGQEGSSVVQKATASEKKLSRLSPSTGTSSNSMDLEECVSEEAKEAKQRRSTGYRMIDLQCLREAMSKLHMCKDGVLSVIDEGAKSGLCSQLSFQCTVCGKKTAMTTSKRRRNCNDVNVRANLAMQELGLGREGMATICRMFGMPPPSVQSSWQKHNKNLSRALTKTLSQEFQESATSLRQCLRADNDEIEERNVIDVVVSYDGTWHHRGFKSSHGVGVVISLDTGKVLDAEVICNTCEICQRSKLDKKTLEFEEWQLQHIESGECLRNFKGPSTAMETAAAKLIWSRSIKLHNMRYVSMLGDGDNKTLDALNNLKPYGSDVSITKLECVNHIHKRMGTGLRTLLKKSPHLKGGLSDTMIKRLGSYYRHNILSHGTSSKEPDDIKEAVQKMQINILASLYHSVRNTNEAEQHKYCMDSSVQWCKYKKNLEKSPAAAESTANTQKAKKKKENTLPESFLPHMLPLYTRLSEENLLGRCVAGLTQNQNESFNATLWRRCPKERYYGTAAVQRALALSALCWNSGQQSLVQVFDELQLEMNSFTQDGIRIKDKRRISDSQHKALKVVKRKKIVREPEFPDYIPGGHD